MQPIWMAPTMFWFQPSKVLQISAAELGGSSAESTEIPNPTGSVFAGLSDGVLLRWLKLMVFPVLPAETETPMSDYPPSVKRPHCAAATIVLPNEYVSGSTIVACWLVGLVNGSVAMIVTATFAEATSVNVSAAAAASPSASKNRLFRGVWAAFIGPSLG